jgi:hypothetical protein
MMNQEKLATIRERYNDLNSLNIKARLAKSSPIEMWTLETLNHYGVTYNGETIKGWRKCKTKDDKSLKRDAEALHKDEFVYAQLKFRQPNSGTDIGCAILQPYPGLEALRKIIMTERDKLGYCLARDYKFDGIIYACLNNTWDKLMILPYQEVVKPTYSKILKEWLADPSKPNLDNWNRTYRSSKYPGAELKWKKDSGTRSWDSGEEKIICYLPISLFENDPRVVVVDMIDPPDYVLN